MNLNFNNIIATNYEGTTIMGNLPNGSPVVVKTRLSGPFTVHLVVLVNDMIVHDAPASKVDEQSYHDLRNRAWDAHSANHNRNRAEAVNAASDAGIF